LKRIPWGLSPRPPHQIPHIWNFLAGTSQALTAELSPFIPLLVVANCQDIIFSYLGKTPPRNVKNTARNVCHPKHRKPPQETPHPGTQRLRE
jgi:hypothetical protein